MILNGINNAQLCYNEDAANAFVVYWSTSLKN